MIDVKLGATPNAQSIHRIIYVKYMVSLRCETILKQELKKLEFKYSISPHGAILLHEELKNGQLEELKSRLKKFGFILLNEDDSMLIERIITTIMEIIHETESLPKIDFNEIFSKNLIVGKESILKIFSDVKGMSVIQFIIHQKVERVKTLLLYDELTISEIADNLHYKSENHLISQFKKITGLTPHYFNHIREERMKIASMDM